MFNIWPITGKQEMSGYMLLTQPGFDFLPLQHKYYLT